MRRFPLPLYDVKVSHAISMVLSIMESYRKMNWRKYNPTYANNTVTVELTV